MRRLVFASLIAMTSYLTGPARADESTRPLRLMTLEPGHFHAALIQKVAQPGLADEVDVYATPGVDLAAHLERINQFNHRPDHPTRWVERLHTNGEPLTCLLTERPGNVVIVSGNNRGKIDRLQALVQGGLSVLADKPWVIEPEDFPKLAIVLETAQANRVVAYDAMTQRFEVSCQLARELANDPEVFGHWEDGTARCPAVTMESVHYLLKQVAGVPLQRPVWFFDIHQQGEGLTDVGTHLVDLVQWTMFPDEAVDYRRDIRMIDAKRWPTLIDRLEFEQVTGAKDFPAYLGGAVRSNRLEYWANNSVTYQLRGRFVHLDIRWAYAPPPGGADTEFARLCGTRCVIEVRQGAKEKFIPEVYILPTRTEEFGVVATALRSSLGAGQAKFPGVSYESVEDGFHLIIPPNLRLGHEAHFDRLTREFLDYVRHPETLPAWEKPDMLAKYYVTTEGVKLARKLTDHQRP
jgi:predicted dehydrogenase